jgi:butyrate kinase
VLAVQDDAMIQVSEVDMVTDMAMVMAIGAAIMAAATIMDGTTDGAIITGGIADATIITVIGAEGTRKRRAHARRPGNHKLGNRPQDGIVWL